MIPLLSLGIPGATIAAVLNGILVFVTKPVSATFLALGLGIVMFSAVGQFRQSRARS